MTILVVGLLVASLALAGMELANSRGQNMIAWAVGLADVALIVWILQ